jgi:hypothetical protein
VREYSKSRIDMVNAERQYSVYRNGGLLNFLFLRCERHIDEFFCKLMKMNEYEEFAKLAVGLLCMRPDTMDCEHGFSHMNLTKTKLASQLTQENLEALLTVYLDDKMLEKFPCREVV